VATDSVKSAANPLTHVQTFVALVSAVVGVVAAVQALSSKRDADASAKEVQALKLALEARAANRADMEARAKLDAIAYEAVVKVLEIDRAKVEKALAEKRERAVLALIGATASDSMKPALFEVVKSGPSISSDVKAEAGAASALLQTYGSQASDPNVRTEPQSSPRSTAKPSSLLKGYRVVVFYCGSESRPMDTKAQAKAAAAIVAEMSSTQHSTENAIRWETKLLPAVLNSSPGYNITRNEIRFNPADGETEPSLALVDLLRTSKALGPNAAPFERRAANQRTPGYLSAFVCGISADA
jgi:hypothetical protein